MGILSLRPVFTSVLGAVSTVTVELDIVRSYVSNATPNKLSVEFTRSVTITDLTDISLSYTIGNAKTINSVAGSGSDTLVFTLNDNVAYGDLFDIVFGGTNNIIDSETNSLGSISSTVDATGVQQVSITSEADLQHWFNLEDNSMVFADDEDYAADADSIISVFDKADPFAIKIGNYDSKLPVYDATRKAAHLTSTGWFQTFLDDFNGGAGGGSVVFTENAGEFHDFWKVEQVGTSNMMAKNSKTANRGWQLNGSTGVLQLWTSLNTTRTFPTACTKIGDGNKLMIEIVRYGADTIEAFVTDEAGDRESLGTVTDAGSWPGSGQTINNRLNSIYGDFYLYQHRSYSSDQRSNYSSIHTEINF